MKRNLYAETLAIADRFGVAVVEGFTTDDVVYPWSFNVGGGSRRVTGMHVVGPGVVYLLPRPDVEIVPAWAVLLHEIGHAYCGTADEHVVAGWTDAQAVRLGPYALRVMRGYDGEAIGYGRDRVRQSHDAARRAGVL